MRLSARRGLRRIRSRWVPTLFLGMFTQIWVAGGEVNTMAAVTNHITTAGGREDERTIYLELFDQ